MVAVASLASCAPLPASAAAPVGDYKATAVSLTGGGTLSLKPGEAKQVTAEFKNAGAKTWSRTGARYVSVYTYGPKYRTSAFADKSWRTKTQPALLTEASVKPGAVGRVTFTLKAPTKKGAYAETFQLAAEDASWIAGTTFTLNITVAAAAVPVPAPVPAPTPAPAPSDLSALLLIRSEKQVMATGGATVTFTAGIKNTGTKAWINRELRAPADVSAPDTRHTSWPSAEVIMGKADGPVAPGSLDLYTFNFSAPKQAGSYVLHYALAADGVLIPGLSIDIPITVSASAAIPSRPPTIPGIPPAVPSNVIDPENIGPEPTVRVGVLIVDSETQDQVVVACDPAWKLFDENGALLGELNPGEQVTAFFKKGKYWFNRGKGLETTSYALRFVPNEANAPCHVINWDRSVTRGSDAAYNSYRNILELRHNQAFDRTWLINELPMEWYLKGIGETSNDSAPEFQKALITTARSYALFLHEHNTKHASEGYELSGYADDQVYRGYDQETRTPTLTQSVEATRGKVVTDVSDGTTALTPYFSSSDGRTRDWNEVWAGSVAWLKSVPAPCDAANHRTLRGHGVGMSASEALCQANQGSDWRSILNYFYSGTTIVKRWL